MVVPFVSNDNNADDNIKSISCPRRSRQSILFIKSDNGRIVIKLTNREFEYLKLFDSFYLIWIIRVCLCIAKTT
jgi:hypothetical protein